MSCVTTCTTCGKCYEEFSEEAANMQTRECSACWKNANECGPDHHAATSLAVLELGRKWNEPRTCRSDSACTGNG